MRLRLNCKNKKISLCVGLGRPGAACGGRFYPPRARQLNPGIPPGSFELGWLVYQRRVGSWPELFEALGFVLVLFFGLVAVPDRASGLVHEVAEGREY